MNYPDSILLMNFPGMGEGLHQLSLVEARRWNLCMLWIDSGVDWCNWVDRCDQVDGSQIKQLWVKKFFLQLKINEGLV